MLFVQSTFFWFFAVVFVGHWVLREQRTRKLWLLFASYFFYAAWDWRFLGLILFSTGVDALAAIRIAGTARERRRRAWLIASLVANLGVLAFFKYLDFFADSTAALLQLLGIKASWTTLHVTLPVGISFYTFQSMSYTIDVFRGKLEARRNPLDVALFVAFFPQLVAGPIVRARDFLPQLDREKYFADVRFRSSLTIFVIGFFKKACVSDNLAQWIDPVFAGPASYSAEAIIASVLLYSAQIYCDFSGYSDMAIGAAGLLGYRLPQNFAAPYFSRSPAEFWRRWHITLSSWLRDYLYIPLGGNRKGRTRTYVNLMLTMLLGGLWHGAAWHFVLWGFGHGLALVGQRIWVRLRSILSPTRRWGRVLAFCLAAWYLQGSWILFRAPDLASWRIMLRAWVTGTSAGVMGIGINPWPLIAGLLVLHALAWRVRPERAVEALPAPAFAAAYGLAWSVALALLPVEVRPFIYFQF